VPPRCVAASTARSAFPALDSVSSTIHSCINPPSSIGADGRYTASQPATVGELKFLLSDLRSDAGGLGTVFTGFDFLITHNFAIARPQKRGMKQRAIVVLA
jgi:hypothetical protein